MTRAAFLLVGACSCCFSAMVLGGCCASVPFGNSFAHYRPLLRSHFILVFSLCLLLRVLTSAKMNVTTSSSSVEQNVVLLAWYRESGEAAKFVWRHSFRVNFGPVEHNSKARCSSRSVNWRKYCRSISFLQTCREIETEQTEREI